MKKLLWIAILALPALGQDKPKPEPSKPEAQVSLTPEEMRTAIIAAGIIAKAQQEAEELVKPINQNHPGYHLQMTTPFVWMKDEPKPATK